LCGDLPKNLSHSGVNPQLAIAQLVDSVSEIGADWVIASQDWFGCLCNPVTSHSVTTHYNNASNFLCWCYGWGITSEYRL